MTVPAWKYRQPALFIGGPWDGKVEWLPLEGYGLPYGYNVLRPAVWDAMDLIKPFDPLEAMASWDRDIVRYDHRRYYANIRTRDGSIRYIADLYVKPGTTDLQTRDRFVTAFERGAVFWRTPPQEFLGDASSVGPAAGGDTAHSTTYQSPLGELTVYETPTGGVSWR